MVKVHEFVDQGLGHSSYLIDIGDGTAAVIDPPRFPIDLESLARRSQLRIRWTFDTHSHADYVTGSPALAARTGATFVAPSASALETRHHAVSDGERVELCDGISMRVLATPGHTPDHHAYVLTDSGRDIALFSGGSLMVGTVGRTDLCGPALAEPLAHKMFTSLRRFADLAEGVEVFPTHGAGSFCSGQGAAAHTSTIAIERRTNALFMITHEETFVAQLLEGFGTFPAYFSRLPELNRLGPSHYDTIPRLKPLDVDMVVREIGDGARIVDARPFQAFAAGHVPGSLSNALRPASASFLGWLVDPGQPLIFVLDPDQDRETVVRQCLDVGLELIVGELDGGIAPWIAAGLPVTRIPIVDIEHLTQNMVDVRQANEYDAAHIPGAINIELASIAAAQLPEGAFTLMCGHGERAMTAASLIAVDGQAMARVSVFDGGPDTWSDATNNALEIAG